uniref:Zinc/iron permease n=1 Tax=Strongyloides stercoralis TaxID=6248 RepID=A0A0K0DXY8_STRER
MIFKDDKSLLMIGLITTLFLITMIAGFIAAYISKKSLDKNTKSTKSIKKSAKLLSLLSCFGGGVFFAVCLLDIFPHIDEKYDNLIKKTNYNINFPITKILIAFGFFLVYFIEELTIKIVSNHSHSHTSIKNDIKKNDENGSFINNKSSDLITQNITPKGSTRSLSIINEINIFNNNNSLVKTIIFAVIMSLHSIFEGIALGVKDTSNGMIVLFISLIIDKCVESFSVGILISKENGTRLKVIIISIIIYALMTPLGSGIGIILQNISMNEETRMAILLFLECLAGGTFLYVTFIEIISMEKENEHNNLHQLFFIVLGFSTITLAQTFLHSD